jgi:hypothetical protein
VFNAFLLRFSRCKPCRRFLVHSLLHFRMLPLCVEALPLLYSL